MRRFKSKRLQQGGEANYSTLEEMLSLREMRVSRISWCSMLKLGTNVIVGLGCAKSLSAHLLIVITIFTLDRAFLRRGTCLATCNGALVAHGCRFNWYYWVVRGSLGGNNTSCATLLTFLTSRASR